MGNPGKSELFFLKSRIIILSSSVPRGGAGRIKTEENMEMRKHDTLAGVTPTAAVNRWTFPPCRGAIRRCRGTFPPCRGTFRRCRWILPPCRGTFRPCRGTFPQCRGTFPPCCGTFPRKGGKFAGRTHYTLPLQGCGGAVKSYPKWER